MDRTALLRAVTLGTAAALAVVAFGLLLRGEGAEAIGLIQAIAVLIATFWLAFGAALVMLGLMARPASPPEAEFRGRAVLLIPVYNENPADIFARVAAMDSDLHLAGLWRRVDIAVLSDTRNEDLADQEERLFLRLLVETSGEGRLFYRRRTTNRGRKAGNIEDFIRRSGSAYDYAVILDADSLMTADSTLR